MSKVEETVSNQRVKCVAEIRETLLQNAVDCTYYVALGKALKRELAEKYGLTEHDVQGLLSVEAVKIVDQIRKL